MLLSNAPDGGSLHVCDAHAMHTHAAYTHMQMRMHAHAVCVRSSGARVAHENEDCFLCRQRDPLAQHVDQLANLRAGHNPGNLGLAYTWPGGGVGSPGSGLLLGPGGGAGGGAKARATARRRPSCPSG